MTDAAVVALLRELVGIDSVNPSLVPGAAGEAQMVAHLRDRLERSDLSTTVVDVDERPSLVAVPRGTGAGPAVVLNGHLDTVGVAGMAEPFSPRMEGDRLYGRGAADMKGRLAAIVVAAEQLDARAADSQPSSSPTTPNAWSKFAPPRTCPAPTPSTRSAR